MGEKVLLGKSDITVTIHIENRLLAAETGCRPVRFGNRFVYLRRHGAADRHHVDLDAVAAVLVCEDGVSAGVPGLGVLPAGLGRPPPRLPPPLPVTAVAAVAVH